MIPDSTEMWTQSEVPFDRQKEKKDVNKGKEKKTEKGKETEIEKEKEATIEKMDVEFNDVLVCKNIPMNKLDQEKIEFYVYTLDFEEGSQGTVSGKSPKVRRKSARSTTTPPPTENLLGTAHFKPICFTTVPSLPILRLQIEEGIPGKEPLPPIELNLSVSYLPTAQRLTAVVMKAKGIPQSVTGGLFLHLFPN